MHTLSCLDTCCSISILSNLFLCPLKVPVTAAALKILERQLTLKLDTCKKTQPTGGLGEPTVIGGLVQYVFGDAKLPFGIEDDMNSYMGAIVDDSPLSESGLAAWLNSIGDGIKLYAESKFPCHQQLQLRRWETSVTTSFEEGCKIKSGLILRDFSDLGTKQASRNNWLLESRRKLEKQGRGAVGRGSAAFLLSGSWSWSRERGKFLGRG